MQRAAGSRQRNEYDRLLAEAVKLGQQHETMAKHFVPRMYDALVNGEGLTPYDAADRIYKDLVGIWQKDTIRRLLPPESKSHVAREMQMLSRLTLGTKAGSSLRPTSTSDDTLENQANGRAITAQLEEENAKLRKKLEELERTRKVLTERILKLERSLAEGRQRGSEKAIAKVEGEMTIVFPPNLFMKTYALMRNSSKPLVLKVMAKEAIDVDRMKL